MRQIKYFCDCVGEKSSREECKTSLLADKALEQLYECFLLALYSVVLGGGRELPI